MEATAVTRIFVAVHIMTDLLLLVNRFDRKTQLGFWKEANREPKVLGRCSGPLEGIRFRELTGRKRAKNIWA
jgi:hypothetical protein